MKQYNRTLAEFLLQEVLHVEELFAYEYYNAHDLETTKMTLDIAAELAEKHLDEAFVASDRNEPQLLNGKVKVHSNLKNFIKENAETGLMAATSPFEYNGQQLPKMVYGAANYFLTSTHNAFVMYSDLTHGCIEMILEFGNEFLKKKVLPKLLNGEWLGTMCLTEPQAGSSLSEISTVAVQNQDGTYKIKGLKIFISAGDHDVTENIIHLVLARIEGAPKGSKGISLFAVPKQRINSAESNDVKSIGIFHKMGQKATPAMHLAFGEQDNCIGFLLGEVNKGLPQMFKMMNSARLGVGLNGISIASAAYNLSLQYAKERIQGKTDRTSKEQCKIIEHADVKRMLLMQKSVVEGGLCLLFRCYKYLDLAKVSDSKNFGELAELLTPVAKTFGAEMGIQATNQGMQVLGGYGYTNDFRLEQLVRDVRISSIYEGTTGIHSLAIMGREIIKENGASLHLWKKEVELSIKKARTKGWMQTYANKLELACTEFFDTTLKLLDLLKKGKTKEYLADATIYMELFSILTIAWQWLDIAFAAKNEDPNDYFSYENTLKYYYKYELSKASYLNKVLLNEDKVTV